MISHSALLVVDMQDAVRLDHPPAHELDRVIAHLNAAIPAMRSRGRPVIFIRHADPDGLWQAGGEGWPLLPDLDRTPADAVIDKTSSDAFRNTRLGELLAELDIRSLIVGGYATEFCVDTTIRSAASRGYDVTALADGHTTRDRPHLAAPSIIAHHNWVWACLANSGAPVRVMQAQGLIARESIEGTPSP